MRDTVSHPLRTALVTGATSGIGRAIVAALRTAGLNVIATGRNPDALAALAREYGAITVQADICDTDAICAAAASHEIDIVINNAGILSTSGPFADTDISQIDAMIDINLKAPLRLTHQLLPPMIARRRGHVLFVGSIAGHSPYPGSCVYGASKAGIRLFCDALRCDLLGTGVRVTEIVPGRVETALYRDTLGPDRARAALYEGYRPVQPEDVAGLVRTVIDMPLHVDVTRMEVLPTDQASGGGTMVRFDPDGTTA